MKGDDVKRREELMDRIDAALNRWPRREGPGFLKEVTLVARALDDLAHRLEEQLDESAERAKGWRYAGMAHFERGMALHGSDEKEFVQELAESSMCYERALKDLKGTGDSRQEAITHFNYANTLRGLSDGEDVQLLEASEQHYRTALEGFRRSAPDHVSEVEKNLSTLDAQLQLARLQERVKAKASRFAELEKKLRSVKGSGLPASEVAQETNAVLRSGPSLEEIAGTIDKNVEVIMNLLGDKAKPEMVADLRANLGKLKATLSASSPPNGEDALELTMVTLLRNRLEQEASSGKVSALRRKTLDRILDQLKELIESAPQSLEGLSDKTVRMRRLIATIVDLLRTPSVGTSEPPEGTRAGSIESQWAVLRSQFAAAVNMPHRKEEERRTSMELMRRIGESTTNLYAVSSSDDDAYALEAEQLHPLVWDVRRYLSRRHIMLCQPNWGPVPDTISYRSVYFSGGKKAEHLMAEVCSKRKRSVYATPAGTDVTISRWQGLSTAGLSVFDLSAAPGPALAQVAYELGIARTLGIPAVALVGSETRVPFDVDIVPVYLTGRAEDIATLAAAMDQALYSIPPDDSESTLDETIKYAEFVVGTQIDRFEVKKTFEMFKDAGADPVLAETRLRALVGLLTGDRPELIFPPWRPHYAFSQKQKKCFHVMPFSESWSDAVSERVGSACGSAGVNYVRGDRVTESNIIRSIWDEICGASHVLVDLTGFNANVALELGIAHTLGKRVLVVAHGQTIQKLFPMIAKMRVMAYDSQGEMEVLQMLVKNFLSEG